MTREHCKSFTIFLFASAMIFLNFGIANAQIQAAGDGYYVAGYGTVYGSFGQASATQDRNEVEITSVWSRKTISF